ncbi:MBL fold metallo-hydrolase [Pseudomonadota bacterium]|nr:MBL fold metallo-hydrolase [Pseudomonadota bacterium]
MNRYKIPKKTGSIVIIEGHKFFFGIDKGDYYLLLLKCPHQGGDVTVNRKKNCLHCPLHNWAFDYHGNSIVGGKNLDKIQVEFNTTDSTISSPSLDLFTSERNSIIKYSRNLVPKDLKVTLIAHASILLEFRGLKLLTDPWFDTTAFNGSWVPYPPASPSVKNLKPDIIIITHEHSDHFNEETLLQFNRETKILFPFFPNKRIEKKLRSLGFKNIKALFFREKYIIAENFFAQFYEPISNFNDAIFLLNFDGFKLLNINDAGINYNIAKEVGKVDVLASAFGSGASGFPLCWDNIKENESKKILKNQFKSRVHLLKKAVKIYQADYAFPFASYFALVNKEHSAFNREIFEAKILADSIQIRDCKVLDLLPGDSYEFKNEQFFRAKDRKNSFLFNDVKKYLESKRNYFAYLDNYELTDQNKNAIDRYLTKLNFVPEINLMKNYNFMLEIMSPSSSYKFCCEIKNKNLKIVRDVPQKTDLHFQIPTNLMIKIVTENMSWDEAYIGYWCKIKSESYFYLDFWRLIQAPYFRKSRKSSLTKNDNLQLPISYFIEKDPDLARSVFGFMGLNCLTCDRSTQETVQEGAVKHGLSKSDTLMLGTLLSGYIE